MTTQLTNYDEGRRRLALARSTDEVTEIRDKAQALAQYARLAKDTELLGWVSEIKVRAERRAGELIAEGKANGKLSKQGRKAQSSQAANFIKTKNPAITPDDSSRWQKLANMPEPSFERAVAAAKDVAGEVTSAYVLRQAAAISTKPKKQGRTEKPRQQSISRSPKDGAVALFVNEYIRYLADVSVPPEVLVAELPANLWNVTLLPAAIEYLQALKGALK